MRFIMIKSMAFVYAAAALICAGNLSIRDVRNWGQWQAQLTSIQCTTSVNGLAARSILTLQFKDTVSTAASDSLELTCNFNLPVGSVVDSMYLWINGKPVSAFLKEIWNASQIYWSIVGVRRDPALLTKGWTADNYSLRVFPFKRREQRIVRICYTTPLSIAGGRLVCRVPADIVGMSLYPAEKVNITVNWASMTPGTVVFDQPTSLESDEIKNADGSVTVVMSGSQVKSLPAVSMSIPLSDGLMVNFGKSINNDLHFSALLDPGSIFNISKNRKKNIVILWNNVYSNYLWDYTTQLYQNTFSYYYYQYYFDPDISAIADFIQTQCRSEDSIAFFFNDGDFKKFGNGLQRVTASSAGQIQSFINNNLSTVSKSQDCLDPVEFLSRCLDVVSSHDSLDFIIIDKYSSYYYNLSVADSTQFKTLSDKLSAKIRPFSKFYGILQGGSSLNNRIYQMVVSKTGGIVVPTYYYGTLADAFKGVIPYLSARFYPVNLTFSCLGTGYPYDVIMPEDERFYTRAPIMIAGKLYNSENVRITFSGVVDGKEYRYDKVFYTKGNMIPGNGISEVWAQKKTERLLGSNCWYDTPGKKDALNLSLYYRILTPVTALLALEPGMMDTAFYRDDAADLNSISSDVKKQSKKKPTTVTPLKMSLSIAAGMLSITFEGLTEQSVTNGCELLIYDMQGKIIADLSKKVDASRKKIVWKVPATLARGMYIVKFRFGKTVVNRTVFLTR